MNRCPDCGKSLDFAEEARGFWPIRSVNDCNIPLDRFGVALGSQEQGTQEQATQEQGTQEQESAGVATQGPRCGAGVAMQGPRCGVATQGPRCGVRKNRAKAICDCKWGRELIGLDEDGLWDE